MCARLARLCERKLVPCAQRLGCVRAFGHALPALRGRPRRAGRTQRVLILHRSCLRRALCIVRLCLPQHPRGRAGPHEASRRLIPWASQRHLRADQTLRKAHPNRPWCAALRRAMRLGMVALGRQSPLLEGQCTNSFCLYTRHRATAMWSVRSLPRSRANVPVSRAPGRGSVPMGKGGGARGGTRVAAGVVWPSANGENAGVERSDRPCPDVIVRTTDWWTRPRERWRRRSEPTGFMQQMLTDDGSCALW